MKTFLARTCLPREAKISYTSLHKLFRSSFELLHTSSYQFNSHWRHCSLAFHLPSIYDIFNNRNPRSPKVLLTKIRPFVPATHAFQEVLDLIGRLQLEDPSYIRDSSTTYNRASKIMKLLRAERFVLTAVRLVRLRTLPSQ